jgi:hypothetical protein
VGHRLHHIQRRPKDWDAFFEAARRDPPHAEGLAVVARLGEEHDIVYLTGRPERCRPDTEAWLEEHGIGGRPLHMRPSGVFRPAAEVKVGVLARLAAHRQVAVVVDDDPAVLAAVEAAGYATFPADWADRSPALHVAQEVEGRS